MAHALKLSELINSRTWSAGDVTTIELVYTLEGTANDVTAKTFALNKIAFTYQQFPRQNVRVKPINIDTISDTGLWSVVATFSSRTSKAVGLSSQEFSTVGGTQNLTQSYFTVSKDGADDAKATDHKGSIGVALDLKSVSGVDVISRVYRFSETWIWAAGQIDVGYRGVLFVLTGQVNKFRWRGFKERELLFEGASGRRRGGDRWEITYHFAASPTAYDIEIGDIKVKKKKGWDHLWVQRAWKVGTLPGDVSLAIIPKSAYVERVYLSGDFLLLNLGHNAFTSLSYGGNNNSF